jgi:hypothetical protein
MENSVSWVLKCLKFVSLALVHDLLLFTKNDLVPLKDGEGTSRVEMRRKGKSLHKNSLFILNWCSFFVNGPNCVNTY